MAIATLSIDLVAKIAALQEGLDKAGRMNEKLAAQVEGRWKGLEESAKKVGAAVAGAFAVREFAQFALTTVDAIDALNDAKDATGSTIERLSALDEIARKNGATMDTVTGVLVKFNGALKEADGKNGVSIALEAIGLDAKELRQQDPAEALKQVATALAGFADDGNKARIVQELFGKSVREVAPFLNDLAAAGELNGRVTTKQAEEAERFNKQLAQLQANAGTAARSLTAELLPALNNTFDLFRRLSNGPGLGAALLEPGKYLADSTLAYQDYTQKLVDLDKKLLAAQKSLAEAGDSESASYLEREIARFKAKRSEVEKYVKVYKEAIDFENRYTGQDSVAELARRGRGPATPPSLPDIADRISASKPAGSGRAVAAPFVQMGPFDDPNFRKLQEQQKGLDELIAKSLAKDEMRQAEHQEKLAEMAAQWQEEYLLRTEEFNASLIQDADERAEAMLDIERNAAMRRLEILKEQGADTSAAGEALDEYYKRRKEAIDKSGGLADEFKQGLGQSLRLAVKGDFDAILNMWENLLTNLVAKAIEKEVMKAVFGDGKSGSGSSGGFDLSKLFSLFTAGGSTGTPGLASGGMHAGGMRLVGERGPELEVTGPARIFNATDTARILGGSGGRGGVVNNITVQQGVGKAEVYQAVQTALAQAKAYTDGRLARAGI